MPLIRSNTHDHDAELRTRTGTANDGAHSLTATDAHAQEA